MTRTIVIGTLSVEFISRSARLEALIQDRYSAFLGSAETPDLTLETEVLDSLISESGDVTAAHNTSGWILSRGDFEVRLDHSLASGSIRLLPLRHSIDSALRVIHTLLLAKRGGFLLHSASAVRNGAALMFTGLSGAGKTTIARLLPADSALLGDEIAWVRSDGTRYSAFGTPFYGDLGKPGANIAAPVRALYLLEKGPEHRVEPLRASEVFRPLMRNILFFAEDPDFRRAVFSEAARFLEAVPAFRLTFRPDAGVWDVLP